MPPVGFEATVSAGERPKTYALDRAATGTDEGMNLRSKNISFTELINRYELQISHSEIQQEDNHTA
jgi:hypothetical protein